MNKLMEKIHPEKILMSHLLITMLLIFLKLAFSINISLDNMGYFAIGIGAYFGLFWVLIGIYGCWYFRTFDL